jgi:AbrB family looped-hinge helix DNA binding protein
MPRTVRIDEKGRITIPREVREELGVQPGSTLFMQQEGNTLRFAPAENPFDDLAKYAIEQHRRGETRSLQDFAREHGIDLDAR